MQDMNAFEGIVRMWRSCLYAPIAYGRSLRNTIRWSLAPASPKSMRVVATKPAKSR